MTKHPIKKKKHEKTPYENKPTWDVLAFKKKPMKAMLKDL